MPLNSLQDLYVEHIQDLYSAEQQIIEALPKLIERTSHSKLRDGFTHHRANAAARAATGGDRPATRQAGRWQEVQGDGRIAPRRRRDSEREW